MGFLSREPDLTAEERARQREQVHEERMKLIELGRPLPEEVLARAKVAELQARMDTVRSNVNAIFSALGPAAVVGVATGASAAVLNLASPTHHVLLVVVIWVCAALVALATIVAIWARPPRPDVARLLREYLARRAAAKADPAAAGHNGDGVLGPADLTPEEIERLSRAIQL
jgi:hypothetical protein